MLFRVTRTAPNSGYGNRIWVKAEDMRQFPKIEIIMKAASMWKGMDKAEGEWISWEFGHGWVTDQMIEVLTKNGWTEETGAEEKPAFEIVSFRLEAGDNDIDDIRSFASKAMNTPNGKLTTVSVEFDGEETQAVVLFTGEATGEEIAASLGETLKEHAEQG